MLAPRFSIRTAFAVLTFFAVVSLFAGVAYRGENWSWGVTIGAFSIVVAALVHAAWFGLVWLFSLLPTSRQQAGGSPSPDPVRPPAK